MPMLFGSTLNFTTFVLVVDIAQVSTLFSSYFRFALRLGFRFSG